jgi:Spy/CpxP family protein refolding chaperone
MHIIKHLSAFLLIVSTLGLSLPLLTHAEPGPPPPPPPHQGMHGEHERPGMADCQHEPHMLRGLELSEAQQDQIFNILHAQAPALRDQIKQMRKTHEALMALATTPQFDENKARQLAADHAKVMATLSLMRIRTEHEIFQVLTPAQQQQVKQRQAQRTQPEHPAP